MKLFTQIILILILFLRNGNLLSSENLFNVNNILLDKKDNNSIKELANQAIKEGFHQLIERILLKTSPSISIAIWAPITDPIKANAPRYALKGYVLKPLLLNPMLAENAVIIIAILLVPFATEEGRPKKISNGKVIKEPPPAIVLMIPTINPTNTKRGYSQENSANNSIVLILL